MRAPISTTNALTLNQLLTHQNIPNPADFYFDQSYLYLDSSLETLTPTLFSDNDLQPENNDSVNNGWELVLLSSTTISQLVDICQFAGIKLVKLNRINHRLGVSSYRFALQATDINAARKLANQYALEQSLELALIEQAPSLATPGLLVMDMDSTTIEIECIDEIAKLAGVGEEVAEVTERAMQGELDFAASLKQRVATLSGSSESILSEVASQLPLMPGLRPLLDLLKSHQWRIAVASGGFTYFTDYLQKELELDATQANVLEIVDGKLTGHVLGDITDAQVKADTLGRLATEFSIPTAQTVAMGDGANDLQMLAAAELGVAYKAKPVVLQQADCAINFSGLDCLAHWLK
ncbi:phosphoserine phosphatase SerB [Thalassotalea litorea]|uniref:Phosphoserine phosphatase n=2 Tax=Thalassotalea litorea TaxID=2020715 RepID=A0A5R9IDM6_9GAMM|nr:phosphoserine phosphatase SerB [Thalassotalea litorea]